MAEIAEMRCQTRHQSSLHRRAIELLKTSYTRWPGAWHAVVFFVALYIAITVYVFHGFQGNWWGTVFPGRLFGVPAREIAQGLRPVCEVGWDGQFYYYQSNDPWALGDAWRTLTRHRIATNETVCRCWPT